MVCETFKYKLSLENKSILDEKVDGIIFDISRYGKYRLKISFSSRKTIKDAIGVVEKYLSEPLTNDHWNKVKDDLLISEPEDTMCRGSLLGDAKFIEGFDFKKINKGRFAKICCGS